MNFDLINKALEKNIKRLEKIDIRDKYARDEIMRSNAIQMSARTLLQAQIASATLDRTISKSYKEIGEVQNGTNLLR